MSRTSRVPSLLRLTAASVVALAALSLSGCLYAQIPVNVAQSEDPDPDPIQTDEPTDPDGGGSSTLSFADGADLPSTAYIEWGDGFMADSEWKVVKPDDGNGGWTYGTIDDTCTAQFWQGRIGDVPVVEGDDSVSSDAMIAVLLDASGAAEITPIATTSAFGYQIGGSPTVENRKVIGTAGERNWIMAARAFTATGVGLYVIVDCTGGDVDATMATVVEKNPIIVR